MYCTHALCTHTICTCTSLYRYFNLLYCTNCMYLMYLRYWYRYSMYCTYFTYRTQKCTSCSCTACGSYSRDSRHGPVGSRARGVGRGALGSHEPVSPPRQRRCTRPPTPTPPAPSILKLLRSLDTTAAFCARNPPPQDWRSRRRPQGS